MPISRKGARSSFTLERHCVRIVVGRDLVQQAPRLARRILHVLRGEDAPNILPRVAYELHQVLVDVERVVAALALRELRIELARLHLDAPHGLLELAVVVPLAGSELGRRLLVEGGVQVVGSLVQLLSERRHLRLVPGRELRSRRDGQGDGKSEGEEGGREDSGQGGSFQPNGAHAITAAEAPGRP